MEDIGVEEVHGRPLRLFQLSEWTWEEPGTPRPFTLLVAADASDADPPALGRFAAAAIRSGCRYVCTWGDRCELVHDLFDEAAAVASQFVMSTWHADEGLHEALYYALVLAVPEDVPSDADAPVVLAIEEAWVPEVRRLVANQNELARLWVTEGD